jgi:hypothetical protein
MSAPNTLMEFARARKPDRRFFCGIARHRLPDEGHAEVPTCGTCANFMEEHPHGSQVIEAFHILSFRRACAYFKPSKSK